MAKLSVSTPMTNWPIECLNSISYCSEICSAWRMKLIFKTMRIHIIISLVTIILPRDASLKIFDPRVLNRAVSLKKLMNSMAKL